MIIYHFRLCHIESGRKISKVLECLALTHMLTVHSVHSAELCGEHCMHFDATFGILATVIGIKGYAKMSLKPQD